MTRGRLLCIGGRVVSATLFLVAAFVALSLVLVAIGTAAGRFRITPVGARGAGVQLEHSDLVFTAPVPAERVGVDDTILVRPAKDRGEVLYRVEWADSWLREAHARDDHGRLVVLHLPEQTQRVTRVVPVLGSPFRLLVGIVQGLVLLAVSMLLIARAAVQRRLRQASAPRGARARLAELRAAARSRQPPPMTRRPWWWTRVASGVVWALGVLALTASATFQGSVSVTQGSITAGHMQLTVDGAGPTNRLTLGTSSNIAPGDTMERALDLKVDSSTTSGIMTGVTLAISPSPANSTLVSSSNGLYIWIRACSVPWTESGSSPGYTYSCSGGSISNVLGTPISSTALSTVGTTVGTAAALSNLTTSAGGDNYLDVALIFATNSTNVDTLQDQQVALTFTFYGTQRSGQSA